MIEQCLLNKNESATVAKSKKISQLNKAYVYYKRTTKQGLRILQEDNYRITQALFRSEKFLDFDTILFLFFI